VGGIKSQTKRKPRARWGSLTAKTNIGTAGGKGLGTEAYKWDSQPEK